MLILQNVRTDTNCKVSPGGSSLTLVKYISAFGERKRAAIAPPWGCDRTTTYQQPENNMTVPAQKLSAGNGTLADRHCCCKAIGTVSPISEFCEEIVRFFELVGFVIVNTPEIETEFNNFTVLNTPAQHPSRSGGDTFYLDLCDPNGNALLLRTHLTAAQRHFHDKNSPPFKFLTIGKVYRPDDDNYHLPMFHQVEGLWVDRQTTISNLKDLYLMFLTTMFSNMSLYSRFRTSYFPFTEPSIELDIMSSSSSGWLEVSGGGLVHPTVLSNLGIIDQQLRGIAFGIGIERLLMVKHRTTNIRSLIAGSPDQNTK